MQPVRVHEGVLRRGDDLDVLEAGLLQAFSDETGRALHVAGVLRQSADAWDAKEFLKFFQETVVVLLDESVGGLGHIPL